MIAESLRRDLASARLERDVAQREVAELRESIAQEIEADTSAYCGDPKCDDVECASYRDCARIARGLA